MDAGQAALLVRVTARVSAVILAANRLVAAQRIGEPERPTLRLRDVGLFVAFIVSHTVHFLAFFQAYITRPLQSWLFAALAIVLLYSVARFSSAALRFKDSPTPVRVS